MRYHCPSADRSTFQLEVGYYDECCGVSPDCFLHASREGLRRPQESDEHFFYCLPVEVSGGCLKTLRMAERRPFHHRNRPVFKDLERVGILSRPL
jgi:hypothetical protein